MPQQTGASSSEARMVIAGHEALDLSAALGPLRNVLPYVLRVLAENVLRHAGPAEADAVLDALRRWSATGRDDAELSFHPDRVLMHDTTCGPALVDIAAMRDVLAEAGADPDALTPLCPVHASIDHSLGVDRFGAPDAMAYNMAREIGRNAERYRFMKWADANLANFHVFAPGTGILHTINLEMLAQVAVASGGPRPTVHAETLIGTDSHTPMINALGVLAWGVGGLEAESVMFGVPLTIPMPQVVGVRLTGELRPGVLATDAALHITACLRALDVVDCFVEFYGPGVSTLSVGARAAIANMAPEYGATTGFFPIDARTLDYLVGTGRPAEQVALVEAFARAQGFWHDPEARPRYTRALEVDLSSLAPVIAGPTRPQDEHAPKDMGKALAPVLARHGHPALGPAQTDEITDGALAIAAITSCTNTADPSMLVTAGLLARRARALGLKPPAYVKTSFAPGSGVAARYLARAGLLDDLDALGFGLVGVGCTTCIGNSGPLVPQMEEAVKGGVVPVAVLSGNRNFPGRIHPLVEAGFLASPPLVVAYALAGHAGLDILADPIARTVDGTRVLLSDLWPSDAEVNATLAVALEPDDTIAHYGVRQADAAWTAIEAPRGARFGWDTKSTYLRRPPFVARRAPLASEALDAVPLIVLGDDVTTDHISPAGAVPPAGAAGRYLVAAGEDAGNLNVFAARRGNYEAMVRGLFTNPNARNFLCAEAPAGCTVHTPSGEVMPIAEAAERYGLEGVPVVIVAGARYGTGSSRDWAAKGASLLGARAVIANSFERIHRTNLIAMGILPLALPADLAAADLALAPGDRIRFAVAPDAFRPRMPVALEIVRANGVSQPVAARLLIGTEREAAILKAGGIIPLMLERSLSSSSSSRPTGSHA